MTFQILINHPCLGLSPDLHLPLVHILLVLAANCVNYFIGGKTLLAAVVLGQAAWPEINEVDCFFLMVVSPVHILSGSQKEAVVTLCLPKLVECC